MWVCLGRLVARLLGCGVATPAVLVRFAKRRAAWEPSTPLDEFQEIEFRRRDGGPDLTPSVYQLDGTHDEAVRAYAEHAAAGPIDPPKVALGVQLAARARSVIKTKGSPQFAFVRDRHREVRLRDVTELKALARELREQPSERRHTVTKTEVISYAAARAQVGDEEWARVAAAGTPKWVVKAHRDASSEDDDGARK